MLHIILLNNGYFPEKLKIKDAKDRVVVIATENDSIPVSAYKNEIMKNIEVIILPMIKDTTSEEGKLTLRMGQTMTIGAVVKSEKEYEIYTDDAILLKALAPLMGKGEAEAKVSKKTPSTQKKEHKSEKKASEKETEKKPAETKAVKSTSAVRKKRPMISSEPLKSTKTAKLAVKNEKKEVSEKPAKAEKKAPSNKTDKKTTKMPTLAQLKKVLGAANSSHAKILHTTMKNSNQITFEMNVRMELAKAGLDAGTCQDIARTLNDEFGKALPTA